MTDDNIINKDVMELPKLPDGTPATKSNIRRWADQENAHRRDLAFKLLKGNIERAGNGENANVYSGTFVTRVDSTVDGDTALMFAEFCIGIPMFVAIVPADEIIAAIDQFFPQRPAAFSGPSFWVPGDAP